MDPRVVADEIRRVLRDELIECERSLNNKDIDRARAELNDAVRKLQRLAESLR